MGDERGGGEERRKEEEYRKKSGEYKTEQLRTRGKSCGAGEGIGRRSDEREHRRAQTGGAVE